MHGQIDCKVRRLAACYVVMGRSSHTKIVSDVEARWARSANRYEVILAFREFSRVDEFSAGQEDELVEESNDIASWLMDREDDSAIIVPS